MGYQNGNRPEGIDQLIEDAMTDLSDLYNDVLNGKQGPNAIAASITFISETVAAVAAAHKELADTRETAAEQLHSIANEQRHRHSGFYGGPDHPSNFPEVAPEDLDEVVDILHPAVGKYRVAKEVKDYSRFKPLPGVKKLLIIGAKICWRWWQVRINTLTSIIHHRKN